MFFGTMNALNVTDLLSVSLFTVVFFLGEFTTLLLFHTVENDKRIIA